MLPGQSWTDKVIPVISSRNLGINDEELKKQYELQFIQELKFARHLSTGAIQVKLSNCDPEALADSLKPFLKDFDHLNNGDFHGIYAELSMVDGKATSATYYFNDEEYNEVSDQWEVWNKFQSALDDASSKVKLALVLSADLPSDEELKRWLGEPIGLLIIPNSCFVQSKYNFPVLPRKHQEGETCKQNAARFIVNNFSLF